MSGGGAGWTLSPKHQALIQGSAITPEVAAERGYRTVTTRAELKRLGFADSQCRVPALLVPIYGTTGERVTYQARPDEPRVVKGKALKYETPRGSRMALDVPLRARQWLGDPSRPLFITEGPRKADAGVSKELCMLALLGVWNWRGSNEWGGKCALPDWESIALNDREAVIIFDSDVMTKRAVHLALSRLKGFLEQRGAKVRVVYLPTGEGGTKVGLDDYLASGKTVDDLLLLASSELREPDQAESPSHYEATETGLVWHKPVSGELGTIAVPLTNFTATIVGDVVRDDGAEEYRVFRIESCLGSRVKRFDVPAAQFESLRWATEHLGPKATVSAGMGSRDRAREAIQVLSADEIPTCQVYLHTGWREVNGEHVYLHAGGAIGRDGVVPGIEVKLDPPLDRFVLPPPPTGIALVQAVQEDLARLDGLARDETMFPLFSIGPTAVVGELTNFCVHLSGHTGQRKTELAALEQRRFGAGMDAEHLPGSWSSTANSLEGLAFLGKNVCLVVDDFRPSGSRSDVDRMHRDAERFLRALGNVSGRGRMRSDGSLRPPKPPRALVLSTGEDIPVGQSLRARMLVLELEKGEVNLQKLTERQAAGSAYAEAMSGFVRWVAGRALDHDAVRQEIATIRDNFIAFVSHGRTASIGAALTVGFHNYVAFAREVEAISEDQAMELLERGEKALRRAVLAQARHFEESDPRTLFFDLLGQTLQSGGAHLTDISTERQPEDAAIAGAVGWRLAESETEGEHGTSKRTEWRPGGERVGWVDSQSADVYLLPEPAFRAAQRAASEGPNRIPFGARTLWKALDEGGLLRSKDADRRTKKVRVGGTAINALHVALAHLLEGTGTTGTGPPDPSPEGKEGDSFPKGVPDIPSPGEGTGTPNGNTTATPGPGGVVMPFVPDVPDRQEDEEVQTWEF